MRRKPTNGSQTYKCKEGEVGTQEGWEKKEKKMVGTGGRVGIRGRVWKRNWG